MQLMIDKKHFLGVVIYYCGYIGNSAGSVMWIVDILNRFLAVGFVKLALLSVALCGFQAALSLTV